MMNSNSTSKLVVGIGLAAVFGVGVSVFAVRAKHESELARDTSPPALVAPSDQNATDATAPAPNAAAQTPIDQTAPMPSAPAPVPSAAPSVVTPTPVAPTPPTSGNAVKDGTDRHVARTRSSSSSPGTRVASAASSNTSAANGSTSNSVTPAPSSSDMTPSTPAGASPDAQQESAQAGQEAASGAGPAADSQITAAVKSEIASVTPGSDVDVTTTNGVVALAGSVPSQDNADAARQAAQRIPGVKHVDASGLTVSNQ